MDARTTGHTEHCACSLLPRIHRQIRLSVTFDGDHAVANLGLKAMTLAHFALAGSELIDANVAGHAVGTCVGRAV